LGQPEFLPKLTDRSSERLVCAFHIWILIFVNTEGLQPIVFV
jgi:hypothetical protein